MSARFASRSGSSRAGIRCIDSFPVLVLGPMGHRERRRFSIPSRLRWVLLCGSLLVLDGALWSHAFATGRIDTAARQLYPERVQGEVFTLSLVKVETVDQDRYTVREGRFRYTVLGEPGELRPGDEVYVRGVFSGTHTLRALWHERAPDRSAKKILGFLGIGLLALTLVLSVRPSERGLMLRG